MGLIKAKNIWKSYGENIILEKLNFSMESGEFCTLVGPSGCGKSTFLRMLLGIEQPTRGELFFEDKEYPKEPSDERGIVFQRYSTLNHLNVIDNVIIGLEFKNSPFFGKLFGKTKKEAVEKADEILKAVGLYHSRDKYPHELSGGMKQRLSIAQSLVKEPKLLLLDEPFGALDPGISKDMHELLLDIHSKLNFGVVMVTHDISEAFKLGTRVLVFDKIKEDVEFPNRYGSTIVNDIDSSKRDTNISL
ncbi:ABC transporter ATP-binding protein [Aliarcobacter butzleri]|uniref:ABC transporter ATP-binding protein n=1 Tax=Aliarcobacter butzleri TaxID=28197 RepID=UPI000DB4F7A1|nr:ABC transporter ATP-binding protein [Aliarcobacter butzleri]MCP3649404.1 ABC transporter ATP-binding protein [Arcobacter sp. DNRA7]MCG3651732.1 ABC transporter ATP-binding protein [Aliarcobacter butzleri]MCR1815577.1 ABC transporter ATP-binding protein [Aliarcobacter butzleri]MDN5086841.1 ABC transporter ATP-binding protein [Aliarcobacter butzleri]PZP14822.1 MAG: lauroyl acyltransferase [Aliarcobacter butzleri]